MDLNLKKLGEDFNKINNNLEKTPIKLEDNIFRFYSNKNSENYFSLSINREYINFLTFGVEEKLRANGIGTKLVETLISSAKQYNFKTIYAYDVNDKSKNILLKLGFKESKYVYELTL